jgi:copper oxidase (laccase) domain-containing protein
VQGGDHFARHKIFTVIRDHTLLNQRQNAVTDHFGMDTEVFFIRQLHHHRIRNTTVTDLQRRTVFNHIRHILTYGLLNRADFR